MNQCAALCQRCSEIPFDANLRTLSSSKYICYGTSEWKLGKFGDVRLRNCPFCQLVASICNTSETSWHSPTPMKDKKSVLVHFSYDSFHVRSIGGTSIFVSGNIPGKRIKAREYFDPWIDFDEVKRWINKCNADELHAEKGCLPVPFNPAILPRAENRQLDFRLIDVDAMCVVPAPWKVNYVALSYVWGQTDKPRLKLESHNEEALSQPMALKLYASKIPNTIRDAITVVRKLGERYLWVDSLCILQDDGWELQECVAVMDLFTKWLHSLLLLRAMKMPLKVLRVYHLR
jgi:Heterokaryon incompatibility protein (HET)